MERPILFSGPMVRAILDGWKSMVNYLKIKGNKLKVYRCFTCTAYQITNENNNLLSRLADRNTAAPH